LPRQIVTEPPVEILPLPSLLFAGAQFGIVAAIAALDDDDRRAFFPLSP